MAPPRSDVLCPNCGHGFDSATSVIRHLNHAYSSCSRWFISNNRIPLSTPVTVNENSTINPSTYIDTRGTSIKYPFAGHVFNRCHSFMENLRSNTFSEESAENIFHPFASRDEWQLASFLSRAELSMKFVDEFLSLDLVRALLRRHPVEANCQGHSTHDAPSELKTRKSS